MNLRISLNKLIAQDSFKVTIMKLKALITFVFLVPLLALAQGKKSKGDNYFYGYQYKEAIAEYNKERAKGGLSNEQVLNLADAYFKMGFYENASEMYLMANKNDTIISVNRFNNMLQSLSKNSDKERVKTFLNTKANMFSTELLENAEFNYELLENSKEAKEIEIVNLFSNSPQADFSPAFYKESLLFSSSRPKSQRYI